MTDETRKEIEAMPAFLKWDHRFTPAAARICSWCDRNKVQTLRCFALGEDATHGMCKPHGVEMGAEVDAFIAANSDELTPV